MASAKDRIVDRQFNGVGAVESTPLVSVIIPTHNAERYVDQTVRSVLDQTYPMVEIVVVDDGSSDRTPEILGRFGNSIILIKQNCQGVCSARNKGFQHSSGEFVCFLDHDDVWFDWKLQRQVEAFERHPEAAAVVTGFRLWTQTVEQGACSELTPTTEGNSAEIPEFSGWVFHQFMLDCWALTSTVMMRRSAFEASGGFDPQLPYSEDWDLWLRLSREYPFVMLSDISTLYRQTPGQGSRVVRPIDYRSQLLISARRKWGLQSRDGRSLTNRQFMHKLAAYHMQFGLQHLQRGDRHIGIASLGEAWTANPAKLRYAAAWLAARFGWTPRTWPD